MQLIQCHSVWIWFPSKMALISAKRKKSPSVYCGFVRYLKIRAVDCKSNCPDNIDTQMKQIENRNSYGNEFTFEEKIHEVLTKIHIYRRQKRAAAVVLNIYKAIRKRNLTVKAFYVSTEFSYFYKIKRFYDRESRDRAKACIFISCYQCKWRNLIKTVPSHHQ